MLSAHKTHWKELHKRNKGLESKTAHNAAIQHPDF